MQNSSALGVAAGLSGFIASGGSINIYMAHGGTNWGFYNGANGGGTSFQPVITSYDYSALLAEGGGHGYAHDGDKYTAAQLVLRYWNPVDAPPEPAALPVSAYGSVTLTESVPLWGNQDALAAPVTTQGIVPMEAPELNISQGFALYVGTKLATVSTQRATVRVQNPADLAWVFATTSSTQQSTSAVGAVYRPENSPLTANGAFSGAGAFPALLIENFGHINYGHGMDTDRKGFEGVTIDGTAYTGPWRITPMTLDYANGWSSRLPWAATAVPAMTKLMPTFFRGTLNVAGAPADTYLSMCGWGKGVAWINGYNLGRYWETRGPQHTLYIPAPVLRTGANELLIFETNFTAASGAPTVNFVAEPDFTGASCSRFDAAATRNTPLIESAKEADTARRGGIAARTSSPRVVAPESAPQLAAGARRVQGSCTRPVSELNVTLQDCASAGVGATSWTLQAAKPGLTGGHFALASSPSLCLGIFGTNPGTGTPNVALRSCSATDRSQDWLWFPDHGGALMSVTEGLLLDVPNSDGSAGTRLELYSSNGGNDNQRWTFDASTGRLTTRLNGNCVAAC